MSQVGSWQRMHQFRVMASKGERMQEVEKKKVRLRCCHFRRRRGGAKIMDGRMTLSAWRLSVSVSHQRFFFPSDKTSRAPPKKIGSNLHGLLHAARQMEKLELAGLGQMRHSLKINWTGIGIKGGNQKLRRDQWDGMLVLA